MASLVAGFFAGLAEVAVGYPFDTVKTRLQTQSPENDHFSGLSGAWKCCKSTFKLEGIGGFYRGILPLMLQEALGIAFLFGARDWMKENYGADISRPGIFLISCCLIGFFEAVLYCPLDHVKARMQVKNCGFERLPVNGKLARSPTPETSPVKLRQSSSNGSSGRDSSASSTTATTLEKGSTPGRSRGRPANHNEAVEGKPMPGSRSQFPASDSLPSVSVPSGKTDILSCAWTVVRSRGITGLYLGFVLQALKEMVGNVALFGTYDSLILIGRNRAALGMTSWIFLWPAGSLAVVAYYLMSFPFDTMKSKLQTDSIVSPRYRNSLHCIQRVLEESSFSELYHGISMCLLRAIPGGAVEFFVFEFSVLFISHGFQLFSSGAAGSNPLLSQMAAFISEQPELI